MAASAGGSSTAGADEAGPAAAVTRQQAETAWGRMCEAFFFREDEQAKRVLLAFERATADAARERAAAGAAGVHAAAVAVQVDETALASDPSELEALRQCGISVTEAGRPALPAEYVPGFEAIKSRIRASFHRHRGALVRREFQHLYAVLRAAAARDEAARGAEAAAVDEGEGGGGAADHAGAGEAATGRPVPLPHHAHEPGVAEFYRSVGDLARQGRTASGIEDATRAFRQAFAERVGASAFFKGMRGWLEQQVTQDNVVAWTLHDACFTEAAGDDFTRAALGYLLLVLRCTVEPPPGPLTADTPAAAGTAPEGAPAVDAPTSEAAAERAWSVSPALSDARLRRVIRLLPSARDFAGRGAGAVAAMARHRTNRDGEMDPPDERGFLQTWCAVL